LLSEIVTIFDNEQSKKEPFLILVKTILAFGVTILAMFLFIPIGLPVFILGFLGFRKLTSWVTYRLAQVWAKGVVFITGCKPEVVGKEHIPLKGGICFVSNHVGIFDIILALAYIGRPFGFIAKRELLLLPFFNLWIYFLGGLFIDRKNIRKAIVTIDNGIKKIKNGGNMLIFPEGTRSKGRGLLPFRSGSIKLATHSLATIVPIAITGSYDVFEKYNRVHAAPVRVVFCPPIITADMSADNRRHHLTDQVRGVIEGALAESYAPLVSV
jgi:1-acyl-sn-glycerol-3-phosphate acyltransferase